LTEQKQVFQASKDQVQRVLHGSKVTNLFKYAERFGVVRRGATATQYLFHAVDTKGWECTSITGIKGAAKSNLLLQRGYAVYRDWDKVHSHVVMEPNDLIGVLESAGEERIPWIGADDLGKHFPKNLYHARRKVYIELAENWELMRTIINCFDFTATRKNKVATFFIDELSIENSF